ncbi:GNAT family N-acetyltransferase [Chloroflexota bacterium]
MINSTKIGLRNKKLSDARNDYTWQADLELARLDAALPLTVSFTQYLLDYTWELQSSSLTSYRFAIETLDGEHIGNCSYHNINETKGEAELGIMLGNRDYWDKGYGTDAINTLVNYIFQHTNLNRIYLKTLDSNARAQKCFRKCGFTPYGHMARDGYDFVLMEIPRKQWQQQAKNRNLTEPPPKEE